METAVPEIRYPSRGYLDVCVWCESDLPHTARRPRKHCNETCRKNFQRHGGKREAEVNRDKQAQREKKLVLHQPDDYCSVCHVLIHSSLRSVATHPECEERKQVTATGEKWVRTTFEGRKPVAEYVAVAPKQWVVVSSPSTTVVEFLPEWQMRDYHRLDCVYQFKVYRTLHRKLTDEDRINGFTTKIVVSGFASGEQPSRCGCFTSEVTKHIEGGWSGPYGRIWIDGRWYGDFRSRRWVTTRVFTRTVKISVERSQCEECLNEGREREQL
jgi:hypothetical protein